MERLLPRGTHYGRENSDNGHRLHGFTHPYTALAMAERDYDISPIRSAPLRKVLYPYGPSQFGGASARILPAFLC